MQTNPEQQLGNFRRRVARGEYRVDSERVASAILQKLGALAIGREVNSERVGHIRPVEANDRRVA